MGKERLFFGRESDRHETDAVIASVQVFTQSFSGGSISLGGGYLWARVSDALVAAVGPTKEARNLHSRSALK